jgi:hypothetical protein
MGGGPDRGGDARRRERLAEELRQNLKRRKAQTRGRAAVRPPAPKLPETPPETEGLPDGSH